MKPIALMRIERLDAKTCATCRELDGTVVPIGSPNVHYITALAHPGCRRVVVEIYAEDVPEQYRHVLDIIPQNVKRFGGTYTPVEQIPDFLSPPERWVQSNLGYDSEAYLEFLKQTREVSHEG